MTFVKEVTAEELFPVKGGDAEPYVLAPLDPRNFSFFRILDISYEDYSALMTSIYRVPGFLDKENPLRYSSMCGVEHCMFFNTCKENFADFRFVLNLDRLAIDYRSFPSAAFSSYEIFSLYCVYYYYYYLIKIRTLGLHPYHQTSSNIALYDSWKTSYASVFKQLKGLGLPMQPITYLSFVLVGVPIVVDVPVLKVPLHNNDGISTVGKVDIIDELAAIPSVALAYDERGFKPNGQVKLFIVEVKYILDYLESGGDVPTDIVYLGSAPGHHLAAIIPYFPQFRFTLVDPTVTAVIPGARYSGIDQLSIYDWSSSKVLVISDIFVTSSVEMFSLVDSYVGCLSDLGAVVLQVMEKQFVQYNSSLTHVRDGSRILFQPYLKGTSAEMRSISRGLSPVVSYPSSQLERGANFFRQRVRCADVSSVAYQITGCPCVDCLLLQLQVSRLCSYNRSLFNRDIYTAVRELFKPSKGLNNDVFTAANSVGFDVSVDHFWDYYSQFGDISASIDGLEYHVYMDGRYFTTLRMDYYPKPSKIDGAPHLLVFPQRILTLREGFCAVPPLYDKGGRLFVKIMNSYIEMTENNRRCFKCKKAGLIPGSAYLLNGDNHMDCGCYITVLADNTVHDLGLCAHLISGAQSYL
jgi:hypothetical protein